MLTLTSLEPSISMSPKLYRHQPHSKVPSAFRTECGHCLSFSGCSSVSGLPPESKNKGSEGVLGSPVATAYCSGDCHCFVSVCLFLPTDLLFGVPGKYSGVSLYTRKRMVSYTITLVFQRYHAK